VKIGARAYHGLTLLAAMLLTACSLTVAPPEAQSSPSLTGVPEEPVVVRPQPAFELAGRILYVENGMLHQYEDGTTTQLTDDDRTFAPAWSPDGSQIAVARRDEESFSNIYVLDQNGDTLRQVTTTERTAPERSRESVHEVVWADGPAWSPGGTALVYVSQVLPPTAEGSDPALYEYPLSIFQASLPPDEQDVVNASDVLLQATANDFQQPTWSPDEQFLAYVDVPRSADEQRQIWLYDPETNETRAYPGMPGNVYDPVWSPDGNWLAFTAVVDGQTDVWAIGAPEQKWEPTRITTTGAARAAAWSPDSATLAFVQIDEQGSNLYVVPLDRSGEGVRAGTPQQITTSGTVDANSRASWAE
jgi:Tol biopolymer transport system component